MMESWLYMYKHSKCLTTSLDDSGPGYTGGVIRSVASCFPQTEIPPDINLEQWRRLVVVPVVQGRGNDRRNEAKH